MFNLEEFDKACDEAIAAIGCDARMIMSQRYDRAKMIQEKLQAQTATIPIHPGDDAMRQMESGRRQAVAQRFSGQDRADEVKLENRRFEDNPFDGVGSELRG